jgi:hypothetical protein
MESLNQVAPSAAHTVAAQRIRDLLVADAYAKYRDALVEVQREQAAFSDSSNKPAAH